MNVLKAIQNQGHTIRPLSSRVCGKLDLYKKFLSFSIDFYAKYQGTKTSKQYLDILQTMQ